MLLYFKYLHPSTPAKRPEQSGPSCYNASRKLSGKSTSAAQRYTQSRRGELETAKGTMKVAKMAISGLARVATRAVSPIVATYPCGMSSQHGQRRQRRCRPSRSGGVNTHESNEIAPGMSGVLTRVLPAPSTQTIENKRTILRHRARAPRKQGNIPYMRHFTTFCDIL